jgi:hypothetical protein
VDNYYFAIVEVGEGIKCVVFEPVIHYPSFGGRVERVCYKGAMLKEVGDLLPGGLRDKEGKTGNFSLCV